MLCKQTFFVLLLLQRVETIFHFYWCVVVSMNELIFLDSSVHIHLVDMHTMYLNVNKFKWHWSRKKSMMLEQNNFEKLRKKKKSKIKRWTQNNTCLLTSSFCVSVSGANLSSVNRSESKSTSTAPLYFVFLLFFLCISGEYLTVKAPT